MNLSEAPSQIATNALQAIPFGSIIGQPLKACIEAQAMAANVTMDFIDKFGLEEVQNEGDKKAKVVSFFYESEGKDYTLKVPLLTIVPIPYIAIRDIDISFKASVLASSTTTYEESNMLERDAAGEAKAKLGWGIFSLGVDMKANYSSKKDSKSTRDSRYSVEYTIDVAVKAGQDDMPAGLSKVLSILTEAVEVEIK